MPYTFIDPFFCCADNYLKDISLHDTVHYIPHIKKGKVLKILNGDTILVAALLTGTVTPAYRFIISLKNVYRANTKQISPKMYNSRKLLTEYLLGKIIHIKDLDYNESGVLIANLYLGNKHINKLIVDMGLGTERQVSFSC